MTAQKHIFTTANKPRVTAGEADSATRAAGQCQADLTAALKHIAALEADYTAVAAENHALRNKACAVGLKVSALKAALGDLVEAIGGLMSPANGLPPNWILVSALQGVGPEMAAAGEVLKAVNEAELAKEQK